MATFSSVTRQHVLRALAEYDERGGEAFLDVYGFTPAPEYSLVHEDRRYDAQAVLGVAHRVATGRLATPDEVRNGLPSALAILRKRGFEVTEPAAASRPAPARAPRAARTPGTRTSTRGPATPTLAQRAAAARDAAPALCPTCQMALPATGVCDWCG